MSKRIRECDEESPRSTTSERRREEQPWRSRSHETQHPSFHPGIYLLRQMVDPKTSTNLKASSELPDLKLRCPHHTIRSTAFK